MKTYEVILVYEEEARLYKALGDPSRLQILGLLRLRELCVCELADLLPISQPAVSQHLRRLREVGLVCERRQSYWTYYALPGSLPAPVADLIAALPHSSQHEAALLASTGSEICQCLEPTPGASHASAAKGSPVAVAKR